MARYFYGTKSAMDWIVGHYFYGAAHYTWLANCLYPYGQKNPKSSNPLLIYQDLYQPWKDSDDYDKFITGNRINLVKGVIAKEAEGVVGGEQGAALRELCNTVPTTFFYPFILRVDLDKIPTPRQKISGSGLQGSNECLINDLKEEEFDVLFLDYDADEDFRRIVNSAIAKEGYLDSYQVIDILENRRRVRP